MKILNGIYTKTAGNIILNGQHVDIKNSKMAKKLGIAMIHQELSSFPDLSVSANMFMGNEFAHGFWIDEKEMLSHCNAMFEKDVYKRQSLHLHFLIERLMHYLRISGL